MEAQVSSKTGKRRKYEKLHCEHCGRDVSKSTWYMHYESFFDSASGTWTKESAGPRPDFKFESSGDSSESERDSDRYFSFQSDHEDTEPNDVSVCCTDESSLDYGMYFVLLYILQEAPLEASSGDVEVWEFESDSESDFESQTLGSAPQTNESSQLFFS